MIVRDNSKKLQKPDSTFDHECNVITDTEDNTGIIFQLEGNYVKVSLRDFGLRKVQQGVLS
jgi:hypothetical protein